MNKNMSIVPDTDIENDAPLTADEMIDSEMDILKALRISDSADTEAAQVIVVTNPMLNKDGKKKEHESEPSFPVFKFKVRPLSEKEFDKCREQNTKYTRNKRLGGVRIPEDTDSVRMRSQVIYMATVPNADGVKIWDDPRLKTVYPTVLDKIDMVDALIKWAGVKESIYTKIQDISGYNADATEESVKN